VCQGLELRATASLSAWLVRQGQAFEARTVLVEPYDSFTEGLGTFDLREARCMLGDVPD
jgi:hypothetical protein